MAQTVQPSLERSIGFLTVAAIALHFDTEKRMQSATRRRQAIGPVGHKVFSALALKPGAFARLVPFDRNELNAKVGFTDRTVARAVTRLVDLGLLTVCGSREVPMAQLHLPEHVIAVCRQYEARPRKLPIEPVSQDEIDEALAWLDG